MRTASTHRRGKRNKGLQDSSLGALYAALPVDISASALKELASALAPLPPTTPRDSQRQMPH
jgi:hypothetical protein